MTMISRRSLLAAGAAAPLVISDAAGERPASGPVDLAGTSILITGCSSGFGYLGALHYARAGATVVATMRNLPRPEADRLQANAAKESLRLYVAEIDVLDEASVSQGVEEARRLIGDVPDVLVNNAGIAIVGPLEAQDIAATRLAYETNVFGYQRTIRAILPAMRKRGRGHIVNMSSQSGRLIWPGLGHYCPTKFAVEAMSDTLAYELAGQGVDVTCVQPGSYPTGLWDNRERLTKALKDRSDPAHLEGYGAMSADMGSGRVTTPPGDPQEVVAAIAQAIAAPPGDRPLRLMLGHWGNPQAPINNVSRDVHLDFLGKGHFGEAARQVHKA
ncbi:SDR family oxidoreductase [Sphingopyxis sp. DHUNG17]|uniref:SDR family oxidoreductase n=1 Tax=Sphingopyxis jiangsuensis TaxID=2871171 RepID=UPI00191F90B3|nr:SDR family oxidoreductase [Sphingopyxis lutea]MBL0768497.1 SDR family oxidoreductase [Sphingopyxis lutea]